MKFLRPFAAIACTLMLAAAWHPAAAQQASEKTLTRSARFADAGGASNALYLRNINGSVEVTGYDGQEVRITARRTFRGSASELRLAEEEMELVVEEDGDRVLVYLDAPFIELRKRGNGSVSYRVDRDSNHDDYEFIYDITVEVPREVMVDASTMNRGDLRIAGTRGTVKAGNLNGNLELEDLTGTTHARTLNGDISARYRQSPSEDSEYHTLNGRIEVYYPAGLDADIHFKSLRGELYTDFEDVTRLQAKVDESSRTSGRTTRYRVNRNSPVRIGDGGPVFRFEVLNGDVYIRKI